MNRKRFWLKPNESVGYGHLKVNQVHIEDNDDVYSELDKKRKTSHDFDGNHRISYCRKSKFMNNE